MTIAAAGHRRSSSGVRVALTLASLGLLIADAASAAAGEVSARLIDAMLNLPEHAMPLHAVGDVNEDGRVNDDDRVLIRALVKAPKETWPNIADATCPAAADLDLDGVIDEHDLVTADELLDEGRISSPALYYQSALPCRFVRMTVAVQLFATPGEEVPLWVIDPDAVLAEVSIDVDTGPALVRAADEAGKFLIAIEPGATSGDIVLLKIVLGRDRGYLFILPIFSPDR